MPKTNLDTRFIEACSNHGEGTESGNYKKANKAAHKIFDIVTELKKQNNLEYLFKFIEHDNDSVRLWSSSYLLDIDNENRAIDTIKKLIGKPKSLVSFSAKVTIDEWEKGTLKMYFKD
ncbi:hypothetical protein KZ483_26945 [Paenibacillus sp. sptzw28]|uniref:hypothetical protein n=1 Tax=Paenibacillus sp. sptzw28 TaxID=715179 RepID=UPI001C6DF0B4|nr:hypothetical protein [Paenibacillus sp. sptzw28]QYR21275.1 hypothetical protein KZ483_26945 [Paenibacillus sp. sptzw28]